MAASAWPLALRLVTDSVTELEDKCGDDSGYSIGDPLLTNGGAPLGSGKPPK